jgi:chromosome segregation ATPase
MSAKKKPVSTPLHLLQQLTASLLDHFEQACAQALADAEKVLAKLEKHRVKVQEKRHKQHERIETTAAAGKRKAQAKARANVEALDASLNELQGRQAETRQYIGELKNDIQASLALVQGVSKVREAASKALEQRPAKLASSQSAGVTSTAPASAAEKQTAAVQAIANAAIGEAVTGAPKPRSRKAAPSQVAPLASGVSQATVTATVRRGPRKPRSAASTVSVNSSTLTEAQTGEPPFPEKAS